LQNHGDDLRRFLLNEPRGRITQCVNLVLPSSNPRAAAGFVIMESEYYVPMSGSNTICTVTALLETGMIPMREPITRFTLEAPAGLVEITAACHDGKCTGVTFRNLPAFVFALDRTIDVPGLGRIALREIDRRAAKAGVPHALLQGVLQLQSSDGRRYVDRIAAARTEKQLSDIYEDFIATIPLGRTLFADRNPIRTRGPMQVNIAFAARYAAIRPYPYPVQRSIDDELFTRRGSVYFGIAHLLDYPAAYDRYLYRFADFNAGQYASRNAAFQSALHLAAGVAVATDGALLAPEGAAAVPGATEIAARTLEARLHISEEALHDALEQGRDKDFERTELYQRVFALAQQTAGHTLPRALVPQITLRGPKLSRPLSSEWYADRVNERYLRCLNR